MPVSQIDGSRQIKSASISNTQVAAAAAIALSKLATQAASTAVANITGSTAVPTAVSMTAAATASTIALRDADGNSRFNNAVTNLATTATAAGTTTLTVASASTQQFTGSTTQTVVLPNATTLTVGHKFIIINRSTGTVTVNANGGGLIQSMAPASFTVLTLVANGVAAGTWDSAYSSPANLLQTFERADVLTVGSGVSRFRLPAAAKILGVSAAVGTAPTGSSIIIDVNKNGTTIFTTQGNRPAIAVSTNAAAEVTNMDVTALAAGDYLTIDRDQIGSTVAGSDLTVFVRYQFT